MINEVNTPLADIATIEVDQSVKKARTNQAEPIDNKKGQSESLKGSQPTSLGDKDSAFDELGESAEVVNDALFQRANQKLKFSQDERTGKTIIQIIDKETEEVIRQVPPQEFLNIIYNMNKVATAILKDLPQFV